MPERIARVVLSPDTVEYIRRWATLDFSALDGPAVYRHVDDHDLTRESFCHMCGGWEPRRYAYRVCAECGHVYGDPEIIAMYAQDMVRRGHPPTTADQCPLCGEAFPDD